MVLSGSVSLRINQIIKTFIENDIFLIYPDFPHEIIAENPYSLITICVKTELLLHNDKECVLHTCKEMLENIIQQGVLSDNQRQLILHEIQAIQPITQSDKRNQIEECKAIILQNPQAKFSVAQMANHAFISKFHFIRSFKNRVGLTPHQFLLQARIRKAQKLLYQNNTITDVAMATGFCDQSHFIKTFEMMVGITPSMYKQSCTSL